MAKKQKQEVWIVTLPNGKKQEVDAIVAQKYFSSDLTTTPFTQLALDKVIRLRPVTVQKPVEPLETRAERPRPRKVRSARPLRRTATHRVRRIKRLVRTNRSAAARRIKRR